VLDQIKDYLEAGGLAMPALLFVGTALWTLIGLRIHLLRRGFRGDLILRMRQTFLEPEGTRDLRGVIDGVLRQGVDIVRRFGRFSREQLDLLVLESDRDLVRHRRVIRCLCGVAPLLGLLGTVSGMVETFYSLTAMELFAQSGGVAGGISEALISTQMGLFVAIPGVIVGRLLDRKEEALRTEVRRAREQLVQVACLSVQEAS
jgi:biopolymer transport protein ExbB